MDHHKLHCVVAPTAAAILYVICLQEQINTACSILYVTWIRQTCSFSLHQAERSEQFAFTGEGKQSAFTILSQDYGNSPVLLQDEPKEAFMSGHCPEHKTGPL